MWAQTTSPWLLTMYANVAFSAMMKPGAGATVLVPFVGVRLAGAPLTVPVMYVASALTHAFVPWMTTTR